MRIRSPPDCLAEKSRRHLRETGFDLSTVPWYSRWERSLWANGSCAHTQTYANGGSKCSGFGPQVLGLRPTKDLSSFRGKTKRLFPGRRAATTTCWRCKAPTSYILYLSGAGGNRTLTDYSPAVLSHHDSLESLPQLVAWPSVLGYYM